MMIDLFGDLWQKPIEESANASRLHQYPAWTGHIYNQALSTQNGFFKSANSANFETHFF
jgi:hypothetical protein